MNAINLPRKILAIPLLLSLQAFAAIKPAAAITKNATLSLESVVSSETLIHQTIPLVETSFNVVLFTQGIFYGVLVMIVLLHLLCALLFNDKAYTYFALATLSLSILFLYNDGILSLVMATTTTMNSGFYTILICLNLGITSLFASKYLLIHEHFPKLKSFTTPLYICALILASVAYFIEIPEFIFASNTLSLTVFASYLGAGVLLFSKKNYAKFFVIAFTIPMLFAVDFYAFKLLNSSFLGSEAVHLKYALFIAMLLMSYALIYRMNELKQEDAVKKTQVQLFLNKQKAMSRDTIAKMIENVYLENLIMQYDLSGIEIKLLQYISEQKTNEKIGKKLHLSLQEVEELTNELYLKLEIPQEVENDYALLNTQPDYLYN